METMLVAVFDSGLKARDALHALDTFIGMLTGGVGLAIGAATGFALGATTDVFDKKLERDFLANVESALEPGDSAVFAQI
jgi:uncharacterized membrane protein